ncbi:MAG: hypothetical protein Q4P15_05705 [Propionibacteriaceae bacterium]|nr:hypothetical protein [Propionibacteriaceae bacterium]
MTETHRFIASAVAVLLLSGCTGTTNQPSDVQEPLPVASSSSTASSATPTLLPADSPATPTDNSPMPSASDSDTPAKTTTEPTEPTAKANVLTPVPKVQRSDGASIPTISASPADITENVTYADNVTLRINDIEFGEETKEGPGRFPGRSFAVLSLEMFNGGNQPLDLNAAVITVLDAETELVAPVYAEEAEVADFSGTVQPGRTAKARYAFAVASESRSQVTVVVDFDGVHTSAVFRGELG